MGRTIAISDIHGCCQTLQTLLKKINHTPEDQLIILGDLINRGPRSKEVLDLFLDLQAQRYPLIFIRGNHEVMFMEAFADPRLVPRFLRAGGDATLRSFGVDSPRDIPERYVDFIHHMRDYYIDDLAVYVHAGLNCTIDDPFSDRDSMHWERELPVDPDKTGGRFVVHGHTPLSLIDITRMLENRDRLYKVDIDNGCVYQREGGNHLLAYFPKTNNFVVQKNID